jgi:hypothetical protein
MAVFIYFGAFQSHRELNLLLQKVSGESKDLNLILKSTRQPSNKYTYLYKYVNAVSLVQLLFNYLQNYTYLCKHYFFLKTYGCT